MSAHEAAAAASDPGSPGSSGGLDMFSEPDDFRPKTPEQTLAYYTVPSERLPAGWRRAPVSSSSPAEQISSDSERTDAKAEPEQIKLQLVGFSPLWGHHLWNAAPVLSDYLLGYHAQLLASPSTCVLELGAASGLPSIIAARYIGSGPNGSEQPSAADGAGAGAGRVVSTDYPDADLITNLRENLGINHVLLSGGRSSAPDEKQRQNAVAEGYIWGADPSPLLALLQDVPPRTQAQSSSSSGSGSSLQEARSARRERRRRRRFDVILLSDLIFNHQAHDAMLDSCEQCLQDDDDDEEEGEEEEEDQGREQEQRDDEEVQASSQQRPPVPEDNPETGEETAEQRSMAEYELSPPLLLPPASSRSSDAAAAAAAAATTTIPSEALARPCCLVFYTHHRPKLAAKDAAFFASARRRGWECRLVVKRRMPVMFPEDAGSAEVRGTVWGWCMTRGKEMRRRTRAQRAAEEGAEDGRA